MPGAAGLCHLAQCAVVFRCRRYSAIGAQIARSLTRAANVLRAPRLRRVDCFAGGSGVRGRQQVAVWHQQKDKLGLFRHWPSSGTYLVLSQLPLLTQVTAMLAPLPAVEHLNRK